MPRSPLGPKETKAIEDGVSDLFDRLKVRLLGPQMVDKRIVVGYYPELSIPGIFEAAAKDGGMKPDEEVLAHLTNVAGKYIDGAKLRAQARVLHDVTSFLHESVASGVKTDVKTVLGGKLSEVWRDVSNNVAQIADFEVQGAKNTGILDGIVKINAAAGVDDPIMFFVCVKDDLLCAECKRLHLLDDGVTPRLWYMSEIGHGYHKRGEDSPKIGGLHPHCLTGQMRLHTEFGLLTMEELYRRGLANLGVSVDARVKNRRQGNNQFGEEMPGICWLHRHAQGSRQLEASGVYDTGVQPCLRVTLDSGQSIEVSEGHEMWVDDDRAGAKIKASQLRIGDKLPLLSGPGGFGKDHFPAEAELLGNLMGDGHINAKNNMASWNFFGADLPYARRLRSLAFELTASPHLDGEMTVFPPNEKYQVESAKFGSSMLGRRFVSEFGLSKRPRRVPARLWGADLETVTAFLRGLYAADGHSEDTPAVVLVQNDREFLVEIQLLLSNLGLRSRLFSHGEEVQKVITYADGTQHQTTRKSCWRLHLGGWEQVAVFAQKIGFGVPRKQEQLLQRLAATEGKVPHGGWRTARVVSIEPLGDKQTYCLTEPMTNTISVNGIVTGNCRCSVATLMLGYGFKDGRIAYISPDWDEMAKQRP